MVFCVIVNKNTDLICKKIKNFDKKYTLCNYKNDKDFEQLHTYKDINGYKKYKVELYGKKKGRANSENKYEFAPPIDNELYFGNILLLMKNKETDEYEDLTKEVWEKMYEKLFGGFEDIGGLSINQNGEYVDDEERSVDSESYDEEDYTQQGYLKDDFVIEDDELVEEEYLYNDDISYKIEDETDSSFYDSD
ncbi:hypothetical protein CL656_06225 [bacterium]|nr:hypothetical protein [bacterium]|tara:strand:+ start:998 stop:1573 length:576 start_codon:yes stop_codon:yes gene_type:complete